MIKTDPISGCEFDASTPWLASLEFRDVAPYVATSNPKTTSRPSVSVTWGRKVDCCGGPAAGVGARYEYVLSRMPGGGIHAELRRSSGPTGWCGETTEIVPLGDCPRHVKQAALAALRREQGRRFDGCTYPAQPDAGIDC